MFRFVVRYLGILKHVPLLAYAFDALLLLYTAAFNRKVIECIDDLEEEISTWEGVTVGMHNYGGRQFNCQKKEFGHIHSNGIVDVLFSVKQKKELVQKGLAEEHHVFKNSGWVSFYIRSEKDKEDALELLRRSYEAKTGALAPTEV